MHAQVNESRRLQALRGYVVLDTAHEPVFDAITELAAAICEAPIAMISLVDADRQWFKSYLGVDFRESPRSSSICAHAMLGDEVMEVFDATRDERFVDFDGVVGSPHIRFYAGAPLRDAEGFALGTVCVIDREPRTLTPAQRASLTHLSTVVMRLLEARKQAFRTELLGRGLDASSSEVYVLDANTRRFIHVNESALANTGYGFAELIRLDAPALLPELDQRWFHDAIARTGHRDRHSAVFETRCRRRDGSDYPVHGSLTFSITADLPLLYLVLNDISSRVAAETAQREAEQRVRTITDNLPALVAYIDAEERYRFNNATYRLWLDRPVSQITGRTMSEVHEPALYQLLAPAYRRAMAGKRESFEFEYLHHGRPRYVRGTFVPEHDAAGAVIGVYALTHDATRVKNAEDQLRRLAHFDPLTNLANRARLHERLSEAIARSRRDGGPLAVLYLDVDRFKQINDCHGHLVGDEVLQEFAGRLVTRVRQTDTVARLGGDEFLIVLEGLKAQDEAERVAGDIVSVMRTPFKLSRTTLHASTSIGIALRQDELQPEPLIRRADEALYRAKAAGRDGYSL